jgi:DNA polymerase-4/DNA polymerase V
VTGGERGAITSASIEAKKIGIGRGISFKEAKNICPELIILPGNYLAYSIFAKRMYSLVREFAPLVEEYSIDECFADITGLENRYGISREDLAIRIKKKLESSLGITFGVGMGPSKTLAKIASKYRKPGGFTSINEQNYKFFLKSMPIKKVWGIGNGIGNKLEKIGINTAFDFINREDLFLIENSIHRPYRDLKYELMGFSVLPVTEYHKIPKSIIKSRTYRKPSKVRAYIYSRLSKNVEVACAKLRRDGLKVKKFCFYLKTQDFTYDSMDICLPTSTSSPIKIMNWIIQKFNNVYRSGIVYRATGICLTDLESDGKQLDLFVQEKQESKKEDIYKCIDKISQKFGDGTVLLGSSMLAHRDSKNTPEKHLDIPLLGIVR